jgi:cathepsin L
MKAVLLACALFGTSFSLEWDHEFSTELLKKENLHGLFQSWRFAHKKVYASIEEEMKRFAIFGFNLERIAQSNDDYFANKLTYRLRMNQFGDLTDEEFHDYYNCPNNKPSTIIETETHADGLLDGGLQATSVDWTAAGKVTPVKNQGQCGSCWSFSATGSMECEYAIAHGGSPLSLSEQQLVDCSGSYGNQGCNGGWYYDAWKYAESEGGLCTESAYPYKAVQGSCKASSCGTKHSKPTGYSRVTADSDSALASAVNKGCVSVAIEADQFSFQYYSGGVLTGSCGTRIDHAVLVTGYGVSGSQEYWRVKNSWGTGWGDKGYVNICRNCNANGSKGECGINMDPYQVSE